MPITVTAPAGVLTAAGEREILPRLTRVLLDVGGLSGNDFMTSIVGGTVHVLDPARVYAGGVNRPVVMVELKLPDIGLPTPEARAAFVEAATETVLALTVAGHEPRDVWVNILNAPDGAWGIGGRAFRAEDLLAEVAAAAAAQ